MVLIGNAGVEGGAVLVDIVKQVVVEYFKTPPGIETPTYLPRLKKAFSVCPGKTKERKKDEVEKTYAPQKSLFIFDVGEKKAVRRIETDLFLFQMQAVARKDSSPLFVISAGETEKRADTFFVFDPSTERFVHQTKALGKIGQFAHP